MVLHKVQQGKLTIRREPFMAWPGEAVRAEHIQVKDFTPEGRHRQLIHWAAPGWGETLEEMQRSKILLHFEQIYYRRVPLGAWFRQGHRARLRIHRTFITPVKIVAKRVLSKLM